MAPSPFPPLSSTGATGPQVRVVRIEPFTQSRFGLDDHLNEDMVVSYMTPLGPVVAAIDGITPLTEWRHLQKSAGRLAAEIISQTLTTMPLQTSFPAVLERISDGWNAARTELRIPETEILGALFCAYVPWEGTYGGFWQMGDCGFGYHSTVEGRSLWVDSLQGQLTDDNKDADVRATFIEAELARMGLAASYPALPPTVLGQLARDGYRHMNEQRMRETQATGDYDWLRSVAGMASVSQTPHHLPTPPDHLVVVTDGWQYIPHNRSQGLARLQIWREKDPLLIGRNPDGLRSPKGFVGNDGTLNPYTDDVGMVDVTFER